MINIYVSELVGIKLTNCIENKFMVTEGKSKTAVQLSYCVLKDAEIALIS